MTTTPDPEGTAATPEDAPDTHDADTWVLLGEAAETVGVSVSALRKWYRRGELPSRLDPVGRRLVPLEAARERASRRRGAEHAPTPAPPSEPGPHQLIPIATFEAIQTAYLEAQTMALGAEVRARVAEHDLGRERERAVALEAQLLEERSRFRFRRHKPRERARET